MTIIKVVVRWVQLSEGHSLLLRSAICRSVGHAVCCCCCCGRPPHRLPTLTEPAVTLKHSFEILAAVYAQRTIAAERGVVMTSTAITAWHEGNEGVKFLAGWGGVHVVSAPPCGAWWTFMLLLSHWCKSEERKASAPKNPVGKFSKQSSRTN